MISPPIPHDCGTFPLIIVKPLAKVSIRPKRQGFLFFEKEGGWPGRIGLTVF
jgi:hypothetical protein